MGWTDRIEVDEIGAQVARAMDGGWLEGHRAALFHDLARLRSRIAHLRAVWPEAEHAVAIKANPLVEVLRACVDAGAGLEAASIEEVHLALAAGCPPERVVFDSPAKTVDELALALALGVVINADNLAELARIAEIGPRGRIGLRVNPAVGAGRIEDTSTATPTSKFGASMADADAAVRRWPWLNGLHVHVGSQGCSLAQIVEGVRRVGELVARFDQIAWVDVGGGLPVAYRAGEPMPEPSAWVAALRAAAPHVMARRPITELGRSIQSPCGFAISRVEHVKFAGQTRILVGHLGADLLLRDAYQPHLWAHEVAVLDPRGVPKRGATSPATVAGPLCFSGDIIARDRPLPEVDPGDWLVVRDTGAYTLGMWSRHCSRGIPRVLGMDRGGIRVLRERETPGDLVAFWSAPPAL